jgi:aspartokinase-like uncharacterized kinase
LGRPTQGAYLILARLAEKHNQHRGDRTDATLQPSRAWQELPSPWRQAAVSLLLDTLLAAPAVTEVVVDTDSDTIIQELEQQLPEVRIVRRPEHLRSEMLVMNDILPHILEEVEADYYLQTHSTNPLLKSETIMRRLPRSSRSATYTTRCSR